MAQGIRYFHAGGVLMGRASLAGVPPLLTSLPLFGDEGRSIALLLPFFGYSYVSLLYFFWSVEVWVPLYSHAKKKDIKLANLMINEVDRVVGQLNQLEFPHFDLTISKVGVTVSRKPSPCLKPFRISPSEPPLRTLAQ